MGGKTRWWSDSFRFRKLFVPFKVLFDVLESVLKVAKRDKYFLN